MSKKSALVTGASSGIGEAFCHALASRCDRIIAVARRGERLEALAHSLAGQCEVIAVPADLATEEGVTRVTEALRQKGPVEYLVNNAGLGTFGAFENSDINAELEMVRVHVGATVSLCRAAIPFMREQGTAYLINVASIGGFMNMPNSAVYGACKAFMVSLSRSLQDELQGSGVRVQCLCPGMTRTELHDRDAFSGFDKSRVPDELWMDAGEVVKQSLAALQEERLLVIPGAHNQQLVREQLIRERGLID